MAQRVEGPAGRLLGLATTLDSHRGFADVVASLGEGHGGTIGGTWASASTLAVAALAQARATDAGTLVVVLPHAAGADPAEAERLAVVRALTATDGVRHRGGIVDLFAADWDRLIRRGLSESLAGRFETVPLSHWSWPEMRAASVVLTASCVGRRAGGAGSALIAFVGPPNARLPSYRTSRFCPGSGACLVHEYSGRRGDRDGQADRLSARRQAT